MQTETRRACLMFYFLLLTAMCLLIFLELGFFSEQLAVIQNEQQVFAAFLHTQFAWGVSPLGSVVSFYRDAFAQLATLLPFPALPSV